jgi:hypothetical protein
MSTLPTLILSKSENFWDERWRNFEKLQPFIQISLKNEPTTTVYLAILV